MSTNNDSQRSYLPRAGMYIGILGAVSFVVFVLLHLEDWTHRYTYMLALIPIPIISLFIARKLPFVSGLLLVASGIATILLHIYCTIGIPYNRQYAGIGSSGHTVILGYTIAFVVLPLIVSGILFLLSGRTRRKTTGKRDS
jgi:thiamine transporter ThiT